MKGYLLASTLAALLALAACSDLGDDPVDNPDPPLVPPVVPPTETVSFADDIQPIFDNNCLDCHGEFGNAGLDLRPGQSFANLVGVTATGSALSRVEPDEPAASLLYLKLTGQQPVMPPTGALAADLTDLVRTWIEEGALDN